VASESVVSQSSDVARKILRDKQNKRCTSAVFSLFNLQLSGSKVK